MCREDRVLELIKKEAELETRLQLLNEQISSYKKHQE